MPIDKVRTDLPPSGARPNIHRSHETMNHEPNHTGPSAPIIDSTRLVDVLCQIARLLHFPVYLHMSLSLHDSFSVF